MKAFFLVLLLWQAAGELQTPVAEPHFFRYQRTINWASMPETVPEGSPACVTLDAPVYAHALPSLKDVRLYENKNEKPYAITLSESAESDTEPARVFNLGMRGSKVVFDLAMPQRPYTDVMLNLDAHDFIASAEVSGTHDVGDLRVQLGTFTIFDLSAQHLSHNATLRLQESNFPFLHVELSFSPTPGAPALAVTPKIVQSAAVPPNREAQRVYTTVGTTTSFTPQGRQTIARFLLPAHVPVERISFALEPGFKANFTRDVVITGRPTDASDSAAETLSGSILRVHINRAGREIRQEQLSVPATIGANLQTDAAIEVRINNGDDPPLPLTAINLEMRERRLCFTLPLAAQQLTLFYGDKVLDAPVYDFARLFSPSSSTVSATLSAEQQNPAFRVRPTQPGPLTERHPELLWIALLAVVCILGVVASHSAKRMPK